jgi:hypothetical protein
MHQVLIAIIFYTATHHNAFALASFQAFNYIMLSYTMRQSASGPLTAIFL